MRSQHFDGICHRIATAFARSRNGLPGHFLRSTRDRPKIAHRGERTRFRLEATPSDAWHTTLHRALKANAVRLFTYVPDRVLTPLIEAIQADSEITSLAASREEEALGILSGAWMAGMFGVLAMQTSGFATLPNALASLAVPYQIPLVMVISERGTLGEFNLGQAMVCRTMRPVLDALGIEHHTITRRDELAFIADRSIKQAVGTRAACALILSPLLTGGKVL